MATVGVTSTKSCRAAINYVLGKENERAIAISGHNLNPYDAIHQMRSVQYLYNKDENYVQALRINQSFTKEDLNPDNEDDWQKANDIGYELAEELYPECQSLVVTHRDGKTGLLHNHLVVNNVGLDGKSLRGNIRSWATIASKSDEICRIHGLSTLDHEKIADYKNRDKRILNSDYQAEQSGKESDRMRLMRYIEDVSQTAESMDDFKANMKEVYGVKVNTRKRKGEMNITYKLSDATDKGMKNNVNGFKLGNDYVHDSIQNVLEGNRERRIKQEELKSKEVSSVLDNLFDDVSSQRDHNERQKEMMRQAELVHQAELKRQREERERQEEVKVNVKRRPVRKTREDDFGPEL